MTLELVPGLDFEATRISARGMTIRVIFLWQIFRHDQLPPTNFPITGISKLVSR
jgi:hypothetical protein